ncbi:hypothetical protein JVU11DRAFT_7861 [Chiua virens]|nr:hypothetical protein JVU11DRAFT_7861 [Chiua virens]
MARIPNTQAGMHKQLEQATLTVPASQSGHSMAKKKEKGKVPTMPAPASPHLKSTTISSSSKKTLPANVAWEARYTDLLVQWILSTGSGIVPPADSDAGSHPQNLLEDVLCVFPHYQELNSIWNGIPSFDNELLSPKSSASHSQNLLKIIKRKPGEAPDEEKEENNVEAEADKMDEDEIVIIEKESTGASDLEHQAPSSAMCLDKPNATEDSGINDAFMDLADVHREFTAAHASPGPSDLNNFTPFSLSHKSKMPLWEGRSAFTKPTLHAHPPNSAPSTSSSKSHSIVSIASKMPLALSAKKSLATKIKELDK